MMHSFLTNNREELLARCRAKVAMRPQRAATPEQLKDGMPLFLEQLRRTLQAEEGHEPGLSLGISGASDGDVAVSEMGVSATAHGKQLLELGFTVDQVVHDYGDMCQAITDLAVERDAPFAIKEFRTLNRCLDNAIADAVTAFSIERDATVAAERAAEMNQRLGFLMHEVRNALGTATLAAAALEAGHLPIGGATGAVLKRSLATLTALTNRSLEEVRQQGAPQPAREVLSVDSLLAQARNDAQLDATARDCILTVKPVDPALHVRVDVALVLGAIGNLLQNAFKFSREHTEVTLRAHAFGDRVRIEVADHCGGLPPGTQQKLFTPFFSQRGGGNTGLGLGLSIARQNVVAQAGTLTVRDIPGTGCVFTIELPQHTA